MHQQKNEHIFNSSKKDLDETTFVVWKNELQKTLPSFWQSMQ